MLGFLYPRFTCVPLRIAHSLSVWTLNCSDFGGKRKVWACFGQSHSRSESGFQFTLLQRDMDPKNPLRRSFSFWVPDPSFWSTHVTISLGVDSPFFYTIVLSKTWPVFPGFRRFSRKIRIPGKNGTSTPRLRNPSRFVDMSGTVPHIPRLLAMTHHPAQAGWQGGAAGAARRVSLEGAPPLWGGS